MLAALGSHAGFETESLFYIPGSAVRGAAAGAYLRRDNASAGDEAFRQLFLEGRVQFGDLRPLGCEVWPLSIRRCRDYPERDAMVDALAAASQSRLPNPTCHCGAKRVPGRWYAMPERDGGYREHRPGRQLRYHVQIDPRSHSALSGQFFGMRTLSPGQRLMEKISIAPEAERELRELLPDGAELRVGRGRSRGAGTGDAGADGSGAGG